jgi:hypothetical protein
MNPRQVQEKEEAHPHGQLPPAQSLEDAANSENTLQGYAAINDVDEDTEIAKEAAIEHPEDREEIARLAHQYYLERGGEHGSHEEDWYRAEEVIRKRG